MLYPDDILKMIADPDDEFRFKCRGCGKCCKNRFDLLLTPRDLFNIARGLGIPINKVIKQFCEPYVGADSQAPIIRIKPQGRQNACPFLSGKRCGIHAIKPGICAMFPIGRIHIRDTDSDEMIRTKYIIQPTECGATNEKHTIRSWLSRFHIELDDPFPLQWANTFAQVSMILRKCVEKVNDDIIAQITNTIGFLLYQHYDTNLDFEPQFLSNATDLDEFIKSLDALIMDQERRRNDTEESID